MCYLLVVETALRQGLQVVAAAEVALNGFDSCHTGFKVSLHPVAEERIRQEAPSPADVKLLEDPTADLPEVDENTPFMTCMQTRAIIFVRLLTIVNGQTKVRLEVCLCCFFTSLRSVRMTSVEYLQILAKGMLNIPPLSR